MNDKPRGYTSKEIQDREQVMDVLARNQQELSQLMKARGVSESQPGYTAFAIDFARTKLGDAVRGNAFIAQFAQSAAGAHGAAPGRRNQPMPHHRPHRRAARRRRWPPSPTAA
ncbi:hypothetical protein [Duganella vulcania]|uniref:Uncharacterized protein n=1 Tax=Duganella vulcania TaxID=2692166 RepID=A0A845GGG1_9BURK|nr:hypothetical protein [Duganella vulcania]MYM92600.1 hypothetical protein [Duganella vulcania]